MMTRSTTRTAGTAQIVDAIARAIDDLGDGISEERGLLASICVRAWGRVEDGDAETVRDLRRAYEVIEAASHRAYRARTALPSGVIDFAAARKRIRGRLPPADAKK